MEKTLVLLKEVFVGISAGVTMVAVAMGITWGVFGGAIVGALLSLFTFSPGEATAKEKAKSMFGGFLIAIVGAPQAMSFGDLEPISGVGVAIVAGIFGLSALKEINTYLKNGGYKTLINTLAGLVGKKGAQ